MNHVFHSTQSQNLSVSVQSPVVFSYWGLGCRHDMCASKIISTPNRLAEMQTSLKYKITQGQASVLLYLSYQIVA